MLQWKFFYAFLLLYSFALGTPPNLRYPAGGPEELVFGLEPSGPFLKPAGIDQLHLSIALSIQGTTVKLLPPAHKPREAVKPLNVYTP